MVSLFSRKMALMLELYKKKLRLDRLELMFLFLYHSHLLLLLDQKNHVGEDKG